MYKSIHYSSTDPAGWLLQMGMTRRNSAQPSSTQSRHIQAVVKHPDFNNASLYNNDIGTLSTEASEQ